MKRWLFFSLFCCRDRRFSVGDQLQKDVQHWLSPPDPSTNQNFVSKARHKGTAAWFFESCALTEWKAKGSFLWIHGKRTSFELPMSALHLQLVGHISGRRKEHASVCHIFIELFEVIHS